MAPTAVANTAMACDCALLCPYHPNSIFTGRPFERRTDPHLTPSIGDQHPACPPPQEAFQQQPEQRPAHTARRPHRVADLVSRRTQPPPCPRWEEAATR